MPVRTDDSICSSKHRIRVGSVEAHNRAKRPLWLSRCYLRSSICFKHPPRSFLPSASECFIDLNQREQFVPPGLREVQHRSNQPLCSATSVEHPVPLTA